MDYAIFKTDKERKDAVGALEGLTEHLGWKLVEQVLDRNIEHFALQLRESQEFKNLESVYALQDRISDLETLKTLPAILTTEALNVTPEAEDPDPYPHASDPQPNS